MQAFLRWTKKNPPPGACVQPFAPDEIAKIRKTLQALIVYHMEREPRTLHFLKME
jgi:DNA repair protein RecO (recombination protein O)